ncbi:60S ribosomal protein L34 [Durusdinium trenchii]|uniref:60S ribosomal protein L34 n=1 Tax=Durusdinium trenchii TaxID=1381693 RepID=A0ABP0PIR1_9DINO
MPHVERVEPKGFLPLAFGTSRPGFSYFHGPIKRDIACELSHTSSEKITISYYVISPQVSLRPGLISLGGLVDPVAYFLRLQPVQTAWVWPGDQTSFYSDYSDYSLEPWSECGVLDFMRSATMARYPARVQLYDKVCGDTAARDRSNPNDPPFRPMRAREGHASVVAPSEVFGDGRMALIGSTALRIDTPDSDLDVVVYTRTGNDQEGEERLEPVEALRKITDFLKKEEALKLQLVDCARVPVLTVLRGDLTVDQPLGEWHVLWFQSLWQWDPFAYPLETLPPPIGEDKEHWSAGLEATALRCIKWWLRRRSIPVSKEGGYPTVVWTLMVLHVLRCSVFVNEDGKQEKGNRALLGAIAAFFDRFAGSGLMGTLSFSMGPDGVSTAFHPLPEENGMQDQQELAAVDYTSETPSFSVLDPTTTCELSVACGVVPSELAPALPPATRFLAIPYNNGTCTRTHSR